MKPHLLTINGETRTITQWAQKHNLSPDVVRMRVHKGWPIEKLFLDPRPHWNGELWTVLNIEFRNIKNVWRRKEIEDFVRDTMAKERKKANKIKYREVRLMFERQVIDNEDRIVKQIRNLLEAKFFNLESDIIEIKTRLEALNEASREFKSDMRAIY